MKYRILLLFFILFPSIGYSQVYLACEFDVNAEKYIMEFDGEIIGPFTPVLYGGNESDTYVYDIESLLQVGQEHTIRLMAMNSWGDESGWSSPFEFIVNGLPGAYIVVIRGMPRVPALLKIIIN